MLDVIFRWKCDECGATHVVSQGDFTDTSEAIFSHLVVGSTIELRHLPRGWSCINNRLICPMHKIDVSPLEALDTLGFAKDIYDGKYGTIPIPIPSELIPRCFQETETDP